MSTPLEDYAMIGDGETAALVSRSGSIDWGCWPRFDSDACFAALLGGEEDGRWVIAPTEPNPQVSRRYRGNTLIVETEFSVSSGAVRLTDFMPLREGAAALVRIVTGLRGSVGIHSHLRARFGYGIMPPWIESRGGRVIGRVGPDLIVLDSDGPLVHDRETVVGEFDIRAGERRTFVLQFGRSHGRLPPARDPHQDLSRAEDYWSAWISRFDKPTHWPGALKRSLLTLKALTSHSTGGIVAAPTTSLPETAGGEQNWDYRYCWIRDAVFTIIALLNAGYHDEAKAWRDWLLRTVGGTPGHVQVMYRIDGARHLNEWTAPWLSGYRWSVPVRIGNQAAHQRQIDVFGEILDVMDLAGKAGIERDAHAIAFEQAIVERVESIWREPGHGLWESRGDPKRYVYSQVMAWVAVDRFVRSRRPMATTDTGLLRRMTALRSTIHEEVCGEGFDRGIGSFVQYFGGHALDASLLLMPVVGFLPIDDPRVSGTIERIERELMEDGLVHRSTHARRTSEGAFLACSCWLADCRQLQGRREAARDAFERVLSVRNDVGLLSEEYDLRSRRLCGNFPQALTHLAIVTTGLGLSGPVLQRGGG